MRLKVALKELVFSSIPYIIAQNKNFVKRDGWQAKKRPLARGLLRTRGETGFVVIKAGRRGSWLRQLAQRGTYPRNRSVPLS